jgi:hypothetical protein
MQGIDTYIPETKDVSREYSVAAILWLLFMVHVTLFAVSNPLYCTFALVLPKVRAHCTGWLFHVIPCFNAFPVCCSGIF